MLKHVTLLRDTKNGAATWKLLGPDGHRLPSFDAYATSLLRNCRRNTRSTYCRHVAYFIDYLIEVLVLLWSDGQKPTQTDLIDAIEAYDDYLVMGGASQNLIARTVDASVPSRLNSPKSSDLAHAAIRRFLKLSERFRAEMLELVKTGLRTEAVDRLPLFDGIGARVAINGPQRQALMETSMFASVVAGGPKLKDHTILPKSRVASAFDSSRAFPFDKIRAFISQLPTHRDKAYYALIAGTGGRGHEPLQILFEDVNVSAGEVKFIDPRGRPRNQSYLYLDASEREKLDWKGRTTEKTFLIEPFATIFFTELELYLKKEYIAHGLHFFVFQYLDNKNIGRPYFLSDASSRREIFKRAIRGLQLSNSIAGAHSLRHSYGMYLLNYFPKSNGEYGLSLPFVQQMMGHSNVNSTKKYAKYDTDLIEQELEYANKMVYDGSAPESIVEIKLKALNVLAKKLEQELNMERNRHDKCNQERSCF
jgi:integrase